MEGQRDVSKGRQRISPPAMPQQEFLFVDAAKAKSSRQGRRSARSFVMQKARRERPWSTSKHMSKQRKSPETTSPATTDTPDLSNTPITSTPSPPTVQPGTEYFQFRSGYGAIMDRRSVVKQEICSDCQVSLCQPGHNLCLRCLLFRRSAPAEDPDNSLIDPFGTISIVMNEEVSELLEYFVTEMAPFAIALDIRRKSSMMKSHWFDTAMSSPAFMHSLLCTSALHQYYVGRGSVETIILHRGKAITAINSAISNPDENVRISDANIGAVFNLLSIEESLHFLDHVKPDDDQPNQRGIHLNGLLRMVQMRGGLMAINSNRILQAFILWHATAHAVASFEAPYLSMSDLASSSCSPRQRLPGYISTHLLKCCRSAQVDESLTALVESTLTLIADLNGLFSDVEADRPLEPLDIQNHACVLQCTLIKWLRDHEHSVNPLEDALCVSLLIFTVRTTEAFNTRSDVHTLHFAASKRLEKALSATSRNEWQSCPELLLWILAVGAISAEGSPESSWFVYQTSLACSEFDIKDADAFLDSLHLCGWVSFKLDEAVRQLWQSFINLRLEPHFDESNTMPGPLQVTVASPDFTDWQNIDWSVLSTLTSSLGDSNLSPGETASSSMGDGEEFLYDFGSSYVFPHSIPFHMR